MTVTGVLWTGNSDPVPGAQEAVRFLQSQVRVPFKKIHMDSVVTHGGESILLHIPYIGQSCVFCFK